MRASYFVPIPLTNPWESIDKSMGVMAQPALLSIFDGP